MFSNKRLVVICDMTSTIDAETGDRKKVVANATKVISNKTLVGIQTQQLAQSQGMNFQYSVEIDRMFYKEQKYLYMENKLYEIKNVSPAKLPKDCKLNVVVLNDENIENAIKEWLNGNILE